MDMVLTPRGLRMGNRILPCSIGRGGLTLHKREGDGATPVGTHRIVGMLYRSDRMARPTDWAIPIKPFDVFLTQRSRRGIRRSNRARQAL